MTEFEKLQELINKLDIRLSKSSKDLLSTFFWEGIRFNDKKKEESKKGNKDVIEDLDVDLNSL